MRKKDVPGRTCRRGARRCRAADVAQRNEALRELRRQRNRVAEWYAGMEHGSAGAWDQVKRGFVTAYGELDSAFVKAAKEFERG